MMDLNLLAALVFGFTLVGFVVFGLVTNTAKGNRMNVADQGGRPTLFIDCDDTLYRNEDWEMAKMITQNIEDYCTKNLFLPEGQAYELYKKHGTCLRGLQNEGIKFDVNDYFEKVHNLPEAKEYIKEDSELKEMLKNLKVDKWVFTASTEAHATNCMNLLGITECFSNPVIDVKASKFFTKHHRECYDIAMELARQKDPSLCYIVDDSLSNLKTAKLRGWKTTLVGHKTRDGKSTSGFEYADHIIGDLKELPNVWPFLFHNQTTQQKPAVSKRKTSRGKRRKAD